MASTDTKHLPGPDHDTRHKEGVDPPPEWIVVQVGIRYAGKAPGVGPGYLYQIYEHDDAEGIYFRIYNRGPNDPVDIVKARERMASLIMCDVTNPTGVDLRSVRRWFSDSKKGGAS